MSVPETQDLNNGDNGVKVRMPGGMSVESHGRNTTLTLILIAGFALVCFLLKTGFTEMADAHRQITVSSQELVCILALDQAKRPAALQSSGGPCQYVLSQKVLP